MIDIVVSEIEIIPIKPRNGQVAFASCIINNQFALNNLGVHTRANSSGYRIVYPMHVLPNGKRINTVYPICKEAGLAIEAAVSSELDKITKKTFNDVEGVRDESIQATSPQ